MEFIGLDGTSKSFPQELVEVVINSALETISTPYQLKLFLLSSSRVCRAFRSMVYPHLFSTISLYPGDTTLATDELENTLALMREFPHICSYPKSLVLWCCTDTLAVLNLHTLRTIISHLTGLDEVKFVGTHLRVSKGQSPLVRTAFAQLQKPHLRIPRLKILCMHGDLPMTRHSWDAIMAIFDEVEETSLVGAGIRSYGASDPHTGAL